MRFLALVFILLPVAAFAHTTGVSYQETDGEYMVDVGYSVTAPAEGDVVLFDFQLRNKDSANSNTSDVAFDDVWVKITDAKNVVVLATGVHNFAFGGPRLSYIFPHPGEYRVSVRYETAKGSLATAEFPLTVAPTPVPWTSYLPELLAFLGGLILAGVLATVSRKRKGA